MEWSCLCDWGGSRKLYAVEATKRVVGAKAIMEAGLVQGLFAERGPLILIIVVCKEWKKWKN